MSKRTLLCFLLLCSARIGLGPTNADGFSESERRPPPRVPTTAKPLRDLVNQLDQAGLQRVIEQLRSSYVDSSALTNQEINQAAVEGLLSRLGPGASLQTKTQTEQPAPNRPFKSELIQTQFGYVRLGSFTQNGLPQLDDTLNNFRNRGVTGLILDLRTMQPGSDFQLAADILSRFVPRAKCCSTSWNPKGERTAYSSSADPIFTGPLAVLVNQDNAGTAEAIAGTLRDQLHALIIGQKTSGRAVEYGHYPIGDNLDLDGGDQGIGDSRRTAPFSQMDLLPTSRCHSQSSNKMTSLHWRTRTACRTTFLTKNVRTPTRRLWSREKPGSGRLRGGPCQRKIEATTCQRPGSAAGHRFSDDHQRFSGEVKACEQMRSKPSPDHESCG